MEDQYYDEWLDEEPKVQHHQEALSSQSLFHKKIINFGNEVIEKNIDRMMEKPILNQQFDHEDDEQQAEEAPEWMASQKRQKTSGQGSIGQQKQSQMTKGEKLNSKIQALFDPLQDEQNQKWTKRHCKKSQRPLTCPSCFNQLTYSYTARQQEGSYNTNDIFGAVVKQNKIIRQQGVSEKMVWSGVEDEGAEKALKQRQENFNIKVLVECQCGLAVGYFDINRYCYVLTNVI